MKATIIHFFGDMISSFFVLVAGILIEVGGEKTWVNYIDPVTRLVHTFPPKPHFVKISNGKYKQLVWSFAD